MINLIVVLTSCRVLELVRTYGIWRNLMTSWRLLGDVLSIWKLFSLVWCCTKCTIWKLLMVLSWWIWVRDLMVLNLIRDLLPRLLEVRVNCCLRRVGCLRSGGCNALSWGCWVLSHLDVQVMRLLHILVSLRLVWLDERYLVLSWRSIGGNGSCLLVGLMLLLLELLSLHIQKVVNALQY